MKFKIGDRVKVTSSASCDKESGLHVGYVGNVTRINHDDNYPFYLDDINHHMGDWQLEYAYKYKVGDRFRSARGGEDTEITSIDAGSLHPYLTTTWGSCSEGYLDKHMKITGKVAIEVVINEFNKGSQEPETKKIMSQFVDFVKKQALAVANPAEAVKREAGIHDGCGELTTEGKQLRDFFLEELVADKLLQAAKDIIADKKNV